MSELKGQLLCIILVLGLFATVAGVVKATVSKYTTQITEIANNNTSQFNVETD